MVVFVISKTGKIFGSDWMFYVISVVSEFWTANKITTLLSLLDVELIWKQGPVNTQRVMETLALVMKLTATVGFLSPSA